MKRIVYWFCMCMGSLLAGPASLLAQVEGYWGGTEWLKLSLSPRTLMVYVHSPGLPMTALDTAGWGVLAVEASGHTRGDTFCITFGTTPVLPPEVLAAQLLPDPGLLRGATYGRQLPDGLRVHLSHRLLYRPGPAFQPAAFQTLLSPGATTGHTSTGLQWVSLPEIDSVLPLCQVLHASGLVDWVQPDFLVAPTPTFDPFFGQQYYLDNTGQTVDGQTGLLGMDVQAPLAWAYTTGSPLITVAIQDEGIEAHEDLNDGLGVSRILSGYSIIDTANGTGAPVAAGEAHGQACAGLLAASHNNLGIKGVAPDVKLLPVYMPFSPFNPLLAMADGLNWAWQNGADVMSNSWTYYTCAANPFPVLTQAIDDGRTLGRGGLGTVFAFAAGNNSGCVGFPSSLPGVLAVGAVTLDGAVAPYANTGPSLDLVAPSSGTVDNVRTLDRMGANGFNVDGTGDLPDVNYTRQFGGTSTATALVGGGAALVLSAFPYLTEAEVRDLLQQSATDMGGLGFDDSTGHGRLNLYQALTLATSLYPLSAAWPDEPPPPAISLPWHLQVQPPAGLLLRGFAPEAGPLTLRLMDAQGRQVATHAALPNARGELAWALPGLAAGLYVVHGHFPDGRALHRRFYWSPE